MNKPKKEKPAKGTTKNKPAKPKQLSAAEKKSLFESFDKADVSATKAKAELDKANAAKSDAVKAIADALGTGPFRYKGRVLNVVCRKGDGERPDTYYFKSPSQANIEEIA